MFGLFREALASNLQPKAGREDSTKAISFQSGGEFSWFLIQKRILRWDSQRSRLPTLEYSMRLPVSFDNSCKGPKGGASAKGLCRTKRHSNLSQRECESDFSES